MSQTAATSAPSIVHTMKSLIVSQMLDLIQGTVQAAVAECKDKTKQFAQTEVEKYLKGAVVMNAIHEEIKRVVPQAVLDALRGV